MTVPQELAESSTRYGAKLARALHYKHTGRIFPLDGSIKTRGFTNVEFASPRFERYQFDMLANAPAVSRSGRSLADQFSYRYGYATDAPAAGYLIQFRESIAIAILMHEQKNIFPAKPIGSE